MNFAIVLGGVGWDYASAPAPAPGPPPPPPPAPASNFITGAMLVADGVQPFHLPTGKVYALQGAHLYTGPTPPTPPTLRTQALRGDDGVTFVTTTVGTLARVPGLTAAL